MKVWWPWSPCVIEHWTWYDKCCWCSGTHWRWIDSHLYLVPILWLVLGQWQQWQKNFLFWKHYIVVIFKYKICPDCWLLTHIASFSKVVVEDLVTFALCLLVFFSACRPRSNVTRQAEIFLTINGCTCMWLLSVSEFSFNTLLVFRCRNCNHFTSELSQVSTSYSHTYIYVYLCLHLSPHSSLHGTKFVFALFPMPIMVVLIPPASSALVPYNVW